MANSTEFIQVTTTTESELEAQRIARSLVEQRLAACVQISGPLHSVYRWQGELCQATEVRLTAKSVASLTERLIAAIQAAHSYDTPEIIVTAVLACSSSYAAWLRAELE